jgi:hypothetical protein
MRRPTVIRKCADCGLGVIAAGEWYMVKDEVWEAAWAGRREPWHARRGQQILCIGCLEKRLGRTLMACDFTRYPVNNPSKSNISDRLRSRLTPPEAGPRVLSLEGRKPRSVPDGAVYIGDAWNLGGWRLRQSKWHNPFKLDRPGKEPRDGTREEVIAKYERHLHESGLIAGEDCVARDAGLCPRQRARMTRVSPFASHSPTLKFKPGSQ